METIKTYDHVNREDHNMSFGISRMEEFYDKRGGQQDEPHRHDFFTVIIVKEGKGEHIIDFKSYPVTDHQVYFINPGQVHQLLENERSIGYAITFSYEFLAHNNIPLDFIYNLDLFQDFGDTPPLVPNEEEIKRIGDFAEQLIEIHSSNQAFKYESLGALLKLLLIQCNNLCTLEQQDQQADSSSSLLMKYKSLLNKHYKSWHGVSEYAEKLHVSSDYLNRVIKNLTGKTAKEHIQNRIILAAKRMIYFSELSNKELAYELGFSEPANFSAFFKKCTGFSPSEFKKNAQVGNS